MSKEAMKLALEALEGNTTNPVIDPEQAAIEDQAITALREALAEQPAQQEPVAEAYALADKVRTELDKQSCPGVYMNLAWEAVVKHHRELAYTSPQPAQQEPVAWGVDWGKAGDIPCVSIIKRLPGGGIEVVAVEYAPYEYNPPAKRTWVGLTDEEIEAEFGFIDELLRDCCYRTEAKLKEKNT